MIKMEIYFPELGWPLKTEIGEISSFADLDINFDE